MGLVYLKNVATLRVNQEKCVGGCNFCVEVCPHGVLSIKRNKASIVDLDLCIECGACAMNCPFNAISVETGAGCAKALIKKLVSRNEFERPPEEDCCNKRKNHSNSLCSKDC